MTSHTRMYLCSAAGGIALAGAWRLVRLYWITELFGNDTPSFMEVLLAFVAGFVLAGFLLAVYDTRMNERDHGPALAELCAKLGFAFSAPASLTELGQLTDSPLLKRYTAILSRMSGVVQSHPVEVLDVSRWVERRDETTSRFEWRHTLVVFPIVVPERQPIAVFEETFLTEHGDDLKSTRRKCAVDISTGRPSGHAVRAWHSGRRDRPPEGP